MHNPLFVVRKEKPWYESKKVWVNIFAFMLALLQLSEFTAIIPESAIPYVSFAIAVLNLALLLFFTKQPITTKRRPSNVATRNQNNTT